VNLTAGVAVVITIIATDVEMSLTGSRKMPPSPMPSSFIALISICPCSSLPTRPTMSVGTPSLATAIASFPPLPPGSRVIRPAADALRVGHAPSASALMSTLRSPMTMQPAGAAFLPADDNRFAGPTAGIASALPVSLSSRLNTALG